MIIFTHLYINSDAVCKQGRNNLIVEDYSEIKFAIWYYYYRLLTWVSILPRMYAVFISNGIKRKRVRILQCFHFRQYLEISLKTNWFGGVTLMRWCEDGRSDMQISSTIEYFSVNYFFFLMTCWQGRSAGSCIWNRLSCYHFHLFYRFDDHWRGTPPYLSNR